MACKCDWVILHESSGPNGHNMFNHMVWCPPSSQSYTLFLKLAETINSRVPIKMIGIFSSAEWMAGESEHEMGGLVIYVGQLRITPILDLAAVPQTKVGNTFI